MVNNDNFSKRLKIVLNYYDLSAAAFAEKINVQRSSISHLLSGRNKPSLDFVLKVLETFKEVELYWLLNGVGKFPKIKVIKQEKIITPTPTLFSQNLEENKMNVKSANKISEIAKTFDQNEIERIVLFFKNGSFKEYRN